MTCFIFFFIADIGTCVSKVVFRLETLEFDFETSKLHSVIQKWHLCQTTMFSALLESIRTEQIMSSYFRLQFAIAINDIPSS